MDNPTVLERKTARRRLIVVAVCMVGVIIALWGVKQLIKRPPGGQSSTLDGNGTEKPVVPPESPAPPSVSTPDKNVSSPVPDDELTGPLNEEEAKEPKPFVGSMQASPSPSPEPIVLREYKKPGNTFDCRLHTTIGGTAEKDVWKLLGGKVDFICTADMQWTSEVLENDGEVFVEKRIITRSRIINQLAATEFGLTKIGVEGGALAAAAIASIASPDSRSQTYKIARGAAELARDKNLPNIPIIGPIFKKKVEEYAKRHPTQQFLAVSQQLLGQIEGRTVTCHWRNGKLEKAIGEGFSLRDEDRRLLNRMSNFADYNVLPSTSLRENEQVLISAQEVAQYLLGLADPDSTCMGTILLQRGKDIGPGSTAFLTGAGECGYDGSTGRGTAMIEQLNAAIVYGDDTVGIYLKEFAIKGTAKVRTFEGHRMIPSSIQMRADPELSVKYECDLINENR